MATISKRIGRGLFLCLALMLIWQVSAVRAAGQGTAAAEYSWQKEVIATVGAVQGDTKVQRAGEAKFKKIRAKSRLHIMDFVATGKNSKLWWQGTFNAFTPSDKWKPGPDVTHGSLGADSVFGFKQFSRTAASYQFVGYVQKGTVRFIKTLPNTDPPSTFIIGTHTAWIEVLQSARAADLIVESKNESLTTVTVLWGKVRVKNVSPETKESRILTSCQEVDVERDQEPGDIKWISTDIMKSLIKRTTIPRTLPEDVPSCERLKTEVILDRTEVFLPPPGVALFPVIVPIPVPGDKTECCPPGQVYDPRTGECRCPCPEGELPPVTVRSHSGTTGECGSCRRGATFNPQTCSCECPCPQGFLLPGRGCVPQCPAGYREAYDSSNSPPYRCRYCVRTGIVVDPVPPPPGECQSDKDCGPCESCGHDPAGGRCVPKQCPIGEYLDRVSCECRPVTNGTMTTCSTDSECSRCQKCLKSQCTTTVFCLEQQRLNLDTCRCEPTNGGPEGRACTSQYQCAVCEECKEGRCQQYPQCSNGREPDPNSRCRCRENVPPCNPSDPYSCPACSDCRDGKCEWRNQCGPGEYLNPVGCLCEPLQQRLATPPAQPKCRNNRECPKGQVCRKGKCVRKPPPKKRPPVDETTQEPLTEEPSFRDLEQDVGGTPTGPRFDIGIGSGRVGPGSPQRRIAPPRQRVPRRPPPRAR
jgi:hypothetical protein